MYVLLIVALMLSINTCTTMYKETAGEANAFTWDTGEADARWMGGAEGVRWEERGRAMVS